MLLGIVGGWLVTARYYLKAARSARHDRNQMEGKLGSLETALKSAGIEPAPQKIDRVGNALIDVLSDEIRARQDAEGRVKRGALSALWIQKGLTPEGLDSALDNLSQRDIVRLDKNSVVYNG